MTVGTVVGVDDGIGAAGDGVATAESEADGGAPADSGGMAETAIANPAAATRGSATQRLPKFLRGFCADASGCRSTGWAGLRCCSMCCAVLR